MKFSVSILATLVAGDYYDGPCKCDISDVLAHVANYNDGNQFMIDGNCDFEAGKKEVEEWTLFCDSDGDGAISEAEMEGENHIHISMHKKCNKVHKAAGVMQSFSCGDGEDGTPPETCGCGSTPLNCPDCTALCTGTEGKKIHMTYTCPDNGISQLFYGKCNKLAKQQLNFACGDNPPPTCRCQDDMANKLVGDTATLVCTEDAKQPRFKIFCDTNGNGVHDTESESSEEHTIKCKKDKVKKSPYTIDCDL